MDLTTDDIERGWTAHARDGRKIGEVEEVGMTHLLVTRGLTPPRDLYVPLDAVEGVDREAREITLGVEAGEVDDAGWAAAPSSEALAGDPGVDGLGYTGREPGENAPALAEDGVHGLGFTGRGLPGDPDEEDASRA